MNPILLLHGALGSSRQLLPLKTELEKANRLVYSFDFSGHGGNSFSSSGFGIEIFAEDLHRFLDINNLARVNIFGYSMGGYVAVWFASQFPERVGDIVTLGTKFDWSQASAEREVRKLNPEKIIAKIPAFARILEHRHAPQNWKELLQKTSSMMLDLGSAPMLTEEILNTVNTKITIALGDEDDMADLEYSRLVSGIVPNGKFVLLENTPHPIEKVSLNKIVKLVLQES